MAKPNRSVERQDRRDIQRMQLRAAILLAETTMTFLTDALAEVDIADRADRR